MDEPNLQYFEEFIEMCKNEPRNTIEIKYIREDYEWAVSTIKQMQKRIEELETVINKACYRLTYEDTSDLHVIEQVNLELIEGGKKREI